MTDTFLHFLKSVGPNDGHFKGVKYMKVNLNDYCLAAWLVAWLAGGLVARLVALLAGWPEASYIDAWIARWIGWKQGYLKLSLSYGFKLG
jgi:hypothetical protein